MLGCVEKMAWQALGQLLLASKQLKGSCEQQKVLRAVVLYRGCKGAVRAGPVFVGGAAEGATQPDRASTRRLHRCLCKIACGWRGQIREECWSEGHSQHGQPASITHLGNQGT